jgi:hypothetical protein
MTFAGRPIAPGGHGTAELVTWAAAQPWWVRFGVATRIPSDGPLSESVLDEMTSALHRARS